MNNTSKLLSAFILLVTAMSLMGCQDQDFEQEVKTSSNTTGTYTYQLSVGTDPATRSLKGGQPGADGKAEPIQSYWSKQTDQLIAYTYSSKNDRPTYDVLSAVQDGQQTSGFTGTIVTTSTVSKGTSIFLFYPASAAVDENQENGKEVDRREYKGKVLYPLESSSTSSGGSSYNIRLPGDYVDGKLSGYSSALINEELGYNLNSYHKNQTNISRNVHLDISSQDGTIETIGKKFDFQYATKSVEKVSNDNVQVGRVTMKHLMGMLGIRFATPDGNILQAKEIQGVYISNVKSFAVFDLIFGKFDDGGMNDYTTNIMLDLRGYPATTTNLKNYIYASLFPGTYSNVRIIVVTKENKCYEKTWKTLKVEAGKRILNNVLFTKEIKADQPFVEVAGVKWATGNFITDADGSSNGRIAPEQWTISKNYIVWDNLGKLAKTVHDVFDYTPQFVDHHPFNKDYQNLNKDIVYNSTKTNNGTTYYRIPTLDDFVALITKAHIIPAYCLDAGGRKIYGVYCYDTNSITPLFRREVSYQELYKFNNVTGLVRANKGLFLPYSDLYKRNTTTAALGTYMATQLSQKGKFNSYYYFFFGYEYESNWMLTDDNNADKRIAAIRPVYVTPTKP